MTRNQMAILDKFFKKLYYLNKRWFAIRKIEASDGDWEMLTDAVIDTEEFVEYIRKIVNEIQRKGDSSLHQGKE